MKSLLLSLFLLNHSLSTTANYIHGKTHFRPELISDLATKIHNTTTTFFEVTKPIQLPKTKPCSCLLLQHDFGYTYGSPTVLANYTPPSNCPSQNFAKIVLQWEATCKGTQFDRIFGVWLGGVELIRSCTAEPTSTGIVWTIKKDITRYYSLLMNNQTLVVFLGNLVNDVYTGVYHVKITVHFYPAEVNSGNSVSSLADLILPISQNLPMNDGLWFRIENSVDLTSKKFMIPQNAYRAVVEVYVSFHENDEFWYTNLPNNFITANNLSMPLENGALREVVVTLDGMEIGAIWPFTVIYTGGYNPLLWRPITGIESFDPPSYDIEVTPFLGTILDGKTHEFAFLSCDQCLECVAHRCQFACLVGQEECKNRSGMAEDIPRKDHHKFNPTIQINFMVLGKDGNLQIVNQIINFNNSVDAKSSSFFSTKSSKRFPLYLYLEDVDNGNGTLSRVTNLTLGYNELGVKHGDFGLSVSSLKNLQNGQGVLLRKGKSIIAGRGSTQQAYQYGDSKFCYFRNVSSSNYAILHDEEGKTCCK